MTIKPEEICGESTVLQQRSKDEVLFLGKLLFSPFYVIPARSQLGNKNNRMKLVLILTFYAMLARGSGAWIE